MDKTDIISLSRKIGTEPFAAAMPEYCGVISVKPTTRARMERIQKEEERFDFSVLEKAIASARTVKIDEIVKDIQRTDAVDVVSSADENQTIIDVRHPDDEELKPLTIADAPVIKIPFYSLHAQFKTLDKNKTWLLYCEKGVMSQLHAQYLTDEGFANVKVYRPQIIDKRKSA